MVADRAAANSYDSGVIAHDLRRDCMMHPDCVTDQARYVFAEKILLLRTLL